MELKNSSFSAEEWDQILSAFPGFNLLQSFAYGEVKKTEGWLVERKLFWDGNECVGGFQAVIRKIPFLEKGLVWLNRGPLAANSLILNEMLDLIKVSYSGYYIRVAIPYAADITGFSETSRLGWASGKLDLRQELSVLRKNLKQKWRNLLNKAEKNNIEIRFSEEFLNFIQVQTCFLAEKNFSTNLQPEFLQNLQYLLPESNKMQAVNAYHDNEIVAGVLLIRYGDVIEYLAGNLSDKGRELGCGQLLLWQAINLAKNSGALELDLGGMDELRTPPGIYHFKSGINSEPYRLPPEIEFCPLNPLAHLVRWRVKKVLGL